MRLLSTASVLLTLAALSFAQTSAREVRLTLHEGTSMAGALSPDGRTVAIDLLGALWTLGVDGGPAQRILDDGYDARLPSWSPDGRRLAFQAYRSGTWAIWTVNADGTGVQQVTWSPFDDREPAWSPDGARIAFSSDRSGQYDVWVITLESGELRQVTTGRSNEYMPAWSPDANDIAFVSDRRDAPGIYAVGANDAERLMQAGAGLLSPSWRPDGAELAYVAPGARLMVGATLVGDADEDVFPFKVNWLSATELLYTADGTIKRRVVGGQGRRIGFSADVSFTRPAFTPRRRAAPAPGPQSTRGIMRPAVSPDGSQVAFGALGDLWLMDLATPAAASTCDIRSLRRHRSRVVAGRIHDRVLDRPRRHDGSLDP